MQRELAPVLVCVCVCDVSLSPPSLPKVREPVEHRRGEGGELVVPQIEDPADHTRERARGLTRVSGYARGNIAARACAHKAQVCAPSVMQRGQRRVTCLSPSLLTEGS